MGKIKSSKKNVKKLGIKKSGALSKVDKKTSVDNVTNEINQNFVSSIMETLKKDSDVMSIHSLKSIKNKFGIKKHISKKEKLKLKKEIFKRKKDFLMESINSEKSSYKIDSKSNNESPKTAPNTLQKGMFVQDKDEEYVKLGSKIKSIAKQKKRKQQSIKDTHLLKQLMLGNLSLLRVPSDSIITFPEIH